MKKILVLVVLILLSFSLKAQNPSWLVGEWEGVVKSVNETSGVKWEVELTAMKEYSAISIYYPDLNCRDKFKLKSTELHTAVYSRMSSSFEKGLNKIGILSISLMDNNYISVQLEMLHEGTTEIIGSGRLKKTI